MIPTKRQLRAMQFIDESVFGGHRPRAEDVLEWLDRPGPMPGKKGRLLEPAKPAVPSPFHRALHDAISPLYEANRINFADLLGAPTFDLSSAWARQLTPAIDLFGGTPATPARYAPDGPPENTIKQLRRLRWLERDQSKGLALTPLGKALLRAAAMEQSGRSDMQLLVLKRDDPLAWGQLLGLISEQQNCYIIDPYLRAPQLVQLMEYTHTVRVLVGPQLRNSDVVELRVLLATPGNEHLELRQAPAKLLHDRYVIGPTQLHMIGSSMNNIGGATTTTLVPLTGSAADAIREEGRGVVAEVDAVGRFEQGFDRWRFAGLTSYLNFGRLLSSTASACHTAATIPRRRWHPIHERRGLDDQ